MTLQQRRIGWVVALVVALVLTGWTVWTTTREVRGPQVADLARVPAGEWRSVNVGSAEKPVWADYRIVEIQRHPTLQPVAASSTRSTASTKPAARTAPEGGVFAVVVSECRCPVSDDLRAPTLRLVDRDDREWTTGSVRPGTAEQYGDAAKSTSIGDDEEGRVSRDVQRLVELFEVAQDARDLDVVVGRVKMPTKGSTADGTAYAVWSTHG